jgi:hypothetical protein
VWCATTRPSAHDSAPTAKGGADRFDTIARVTGRVPGGEQDRERSREAPSAGDRLPTGTLPRSRSGEPWWRYRRPPIPSHRAAAPVRTDDPPRARDDPAAADAAPVAPAQVPHTGSGFLPAVGAIVVAAATIGFARATDVTAAGRVLLPVFGLLVAAAFVPTLTRRHPDEPWLGTMLMWGVAFKILMIFARYFTFEGGGDAGVYHKKGVEFVNGVAEPIDSIRKTGFVMWVVQRLYTFIGADQIAGFLAFGLFAFIGSYFWYRATATAVPFVNRRMYCAVVFFLPSIAFWPASIGKEALMQFGIGSAALGTALIFTRHLVPGLLTAAPGVYLLWAVRPHLFALVTISAALAYLVGRPSARKSVDGTPTLSLTRALGIILLGAISAFAIGQAMSMLGIENLSVGAIEEELNEQAGRTAQGGSAFRERDAEPKSLTPLSIPVGAVTVLLRPFVWEVETGMQIIASVEAAFITILVFKRWPSLMTSIARARSTPFLLYCWALTGLYAIAFSSFSNMGLLVRQRSLVLPCFFVLLCVEPALAARKSEEEALHGA